MGVLDAHPQADGQHRASWTARRAYGCFGEQVDGNDVLAVYEVTRRAIERARAGQGPTLIEADTMRMRGHAEHDDMKYVPQRDARGLGGEGPDRAATSGACSARGMRHRRTSWTAIVAALDARAAARTWPGRRPAPCPTPRPALDGVYGDREVAPPVPPLVAEWERRKGRALMAVLTYLEAIRLAMLEEMERDARVFVIGEDVGTYGGAFRVTAGFLEHFGESRVIDTPISESAIVGAAIGAALMGMRPDRGDAVHRLHRLRLRPDRELRGQEPLPLGRRRAHRHPRARAAAACTAARSTARTPRRYFMNVPGLKIVAPGTPADAKGLMTAAIRDPDPVIYLEHKFLYRRLKEDVPDGEHVVPIGKARVARAGKDVSIITYAAMLQVALEAAEAAAADGIDVEVLDLRTLLPLDEEAILATAAQDGQGDRAARGHAHRRAGRRDRGPHRRARLRVPGRAGRARGAAGHAGALLPAARGVFPAQRGQGGQGDPGAL